MYDISLSINDEFGVLTFWEGRIRPRPNFTVTSKRVVLNQWGVKLPYPVTSDKSNITEFAIQ